MRKMFFLGACCVPFTTGLALAATGLTVDQRGLSFSVPALTIQHGGIVTFTNSDITSHNIVVTGEGVRLNSGLQTPGVPFHAPFSKAGTYQVSCAIHPRMKMTVTVK